MIRRYLALSLPMLLTLGVYGYALRLPYFLDDGPHFQILAQINGLQHWGDFAPFPFYRPVAFTIWKLFEGVGYPVYALHALNVFCFGVAGVLVAQITRQFYGVLAGLIAGCAFVLFPFSYQAVAMVAALFHLTLILGVLMCLWLATKSGRISLMLCWVAGFIGVFSHENGILLLPLLIGYLGVVRGWQFTRRDWLMIVPNTAIVALYIVLWLTFSPNDEARTLTQDFPAAFAVMIQGLIYPFASLARPFIHADADPWLIIVSAGALISCCLLWWWHKKGARFAWFGVGWYVLAILPAVIFLPAGYVLGQTRLALFASAGGAMFWGVTLAAMCRSRWLIFPAMVLMFGAVLISLNFLGMRRGDFLRLAAYNHDLVQQFIHDDVLHTGAVILNAPAYIAPLDQNRRFLIGTEGVLWTDPSLDYSQQVWMNTPLEIRDVVAVTHLGTLNATHYRFNPHGQVMDGQPLIDLLKSGRQVYRTQFEGDAFYLVKVAGENTVPAVPLADFGEMQLLDGHAVFHDGRLIVSLTWQVQQPMPVKTFLHVHCDDVLIAQSDGYAWGDVYPFHLWQPGEVQTDIRTVFIDSPPDCLKVYVGLYAELADAPRLPAFDPQGIRYVDDRVLLLVEAK
ncbi:MAG: hypothetical protein CUN56_07615 [Phototrophicales bacterium]|nr:MAG: hypothetical protein CUN56_07615 [Phototrophicales bacterium]